MNNYHVCEQEGRGKHSIVYKARKKKSLQFVAIKQTDRSQRTKILNECKILSELNHHNILKFHDWIETKKHLWIVTQYCLGGDLLTLIEQDKTLPENTVRMFSKEIVSGLQYLHSNGIIFSDLKPANIFINEYGSLKLTDLGACKRINEIDDQPRKGAPCYMSPELFDNSPYSFQSDLWALGCIMYELAQGHPPFLSSQLAEIIELSKKAETPKVNSFSDQFNDLLVRLLAKQPQKRISWKEIVKHPWFKGDIEALEIPQQTEFNIYLKSEERKLHKLITARKLEEENYVDEPINTTNRREILKFGQNNQMDGLQQIITKTKQKEKEKEKLSTDKKKENKKKARSLFPQLDDSSNINVDFDKVNRNNLTEIDDLLIHSSDNVVKPIIGNKDIEIPQSFAFSKSNLGFDYIEPEQLIQGLALTGGSGKEIEQDYKQQIESELKKIYDGLLGENKIHVIGYFETLIQNSDISNFFIKSKFIPLFLKLIKTYKQPVLRAKICEILGLIIRHATVIQSDILKFGITTSLIQVLGDKNEKVRRKAMAALGQFLFYGATQVDEGQQVWDISNSTFNALLKIVKNSNQDQLTRFYACKTIQNITAQTKAVGAKFAQIQIISSLINLLFESKLQLLKSSSLSAIHHIIIIDQTLLEPALDKISSQRMINLFESMENIGKVIQIMMGLINMQLYKRPNSKLTKYLLQDQLLIKSVIRLLDCQSSVAKGRVILFINFIVENNFRNVVFLQQGRFFQSVDKYFKDGQKYLVQCLQHLIVLIQQNIPTLLKIIKDSLKRITDDKKKTIVTINSNNNTTNMNNINNYANLVVNLMNCSMFQENFQNTTYIDSLFEWLDYFQLSINENLKNTIFQICQKIVSNNKLTDCLQQYISQKIFPLLLKKITTKQQPSDLKFGCMKLLIYLIGFYLPEECIYNSIILQSTRTNIISMISQLLLPNIENLLNEKEPIPSFTFKVLALLFQLQPSFIKVYKKHNSFSNILEYFNPNSNKLTQHTLKIVHSLCCSGQLQTSELLELVINTKLILDHYIETSQQLFIEYPLEIISSAIKALCQDKKQNNNINSSLNEISIESVFELALPLQGYDDVVVREKATSLVKLLLGLKIIGNKGKWVVVDKAGLENYKEYLNVTGQKGEKQVYERMKGVEEKGVQGLVNQIQKL